MTLQIAPAAWANRITLILQTVMQAAGTSLYPVRVQEIAPDLSRQFFPEAPLTKMTGSPLGRGVEGMLLRIPNTANNWGIIYNNAIASSGRINFTLAHEFGHYLLHRQALEAAGITCGRQDMLSWQSAEGQREAEANRFAAYLLMPRNLFEAQMRGQKISLHLMQHVADYFDVSLTAVLLHWLEFTDKRAMLLMGENGFVKWARASEPLFKSGVYLQPKTELIALPPQALAVRRDAVMDPLTGLMHKAGSWPPFTEDICEMTLHADAYEATLTLLLFPDTPPNRWAEQQERRALENAVEIL